MSVASRWPAVSLFSSSRSHSHTVVVRCFAASFGHRANLETSHMHIDCSHVFCMTAWAHRMERQTNVNAKAKAIDPACEHVRTPYTALRTHTYNEHESCMCSSQQAYVVVRANKHTLCNCVLEAYAHSSVFVFTSSFSVAFTIDPSRRSFFTLKLLSLLR